MTDVCQQQIYRLFATDRHLSIASSYCNIITYSVISTSGEKSYKFEEFIPVYKELINEKDTGTFADFMEAFKTFDREGQGFISGAELRHVLSSLGKLLQ